MGSFCVHCGSPLRGAFCVKCGADARVAEPLRPRSNLHPNRATNRGQRPYPRLWRRRG